MAMLASAAVGACAPADEAYPVIAAAELTAIADDIAGPIEILGSNLPGTEPIDVEFRTLAAYRVHLPDLRPRHVVIYSASSCDTPHDQALLFADLQVIRKVGEETHFFAEDILVKGRPTEIDIGTVHVEVSLDPANPEPQFYVLGRIAVVQAPDVDGVPGAWLACGVFTTVQRCVGCSD